MNISELRNDSKGVNIKGTVSSIGKVKEVSLRTGGQARTVEADLKDATGTVTLTLWDAEIGKVKVGDTVSVSNGYVSVYKGKMSLQVGRYGKLEVVGETKEAPKAAISPPPASPSQSAATATKDKPGTPTYQRDRPYYEGVEEVALETDVKSVNTYLKAGWVILRIAERQGFTGGAVGAPTAAASTLAPPLMAYSEIVFVLGKRGS